MATDADVDMGCAPTASDDILNVPPSGTKRKADGQPVENLPAKSDVPRRIRALDPNVVNKIAAGEIIVAPVHALKELIENAVDAGATSLDVLAKDGGLKLLQITDNGCGIQKEDLAILCERHTTSKITSFEDLAAIATYGFRGEALASISHIAHLSVTTKTKDSDLAWRAHYLDGKLAPAKPGQSAEPKGVAGRPGTQITVEDLFYNIPTRRRAFRSPADEFNKIIDMVVIDRIRQIHGSAVANELLEFSVAEDRWGFKAEGFTTNANYSVKKTTLLLFINHRYSDGTPGRRTPASKKRRYSNDLVRTDTTERKITSMFARAGPSESTGSMDHTVETTTASEAHEYEMVDRELVQCRLNSVKKLRDEVREETHHDLTEIFSNHTFVGIVDEQRRLAAIQGDVKLYLIDYGRTCYEYFYQLALTDFGNFGAIKFNPSLDLRELLRGAAEMERSSITSPEEDFEVETLVDRVADQLIERREMLLEYFSLEISPAGELVSLPLLLKGYTPPLVKLPRFLLRLGPSVDWTEEKACFDSFVRELATFYVPEQLPSLPGDADSIREEHIPEELRARRQHIRHAIEHVFFPAFKARLVATKSLMEDGVLEVANLKGLYRVFERC
ncbi:DNA mismatch repair protein Mlh1 [Fusarium oxysporum f. sp. cubense race 1]|uniref:DNA mismatch repair protein Mlh1 n=1 Tax=Fusarium oxysporum f. sp. cubense (strain race 1) TaxID=1229664 RepID=N4U161_FUSC1|nr:DNA mismatch repair protein Mlh1 [Fusarium oxysporum f. sp. cubense race 1]